LVVNFDVFGNVSHQGQTRLYFDLIRNGAEINFLRLLPADARQAMLDDWYEKSGQLKLRLSYTDIDTETPTGLQLHGDKPRQAFAEQLLGPHGLANAIPDPINRCRISHCYREEQPVALQRPACRSSVICQRRRCCVSNTARIAVRCTACCATGPTATSRSCS